MDTKVLYITAVAIAAISSGYYYYSGKGQKLEVDGAQSMTYSAEQIQLTCCWKRAGLPLAVMVLI